MTYLDWYCGQGGRSSKSFLPSFCAIFSRMMSERGKDELRWASWTCVVIYSALPCFVAIEVSGRT